MLFSVFDTDNASIYNNDEQKKITRTNRKNPKLTSSEEPAFLQNNFMPLKKYLAFEYIQLFFKTLR